FHQLTGKALTLMASPALLLFLLGVTVFVGLISGIYPAVVLSGFQPVLTLKGSFKSSGRGLALRKTLVVLQFVITIVLVTGIVIISSQMSFIKHKDLGYNKDALLFLRINGNTDVVKGYEAFQNELKSSPLISGIATSNSLIAGGLGEGGSETVDKAGNPLQVNTARLRADSSFLSVYGIQLVAGSNFSSSAATDSIRPIILNETAVRKIGWSSNEAALGKPFKMGDQKGVVIGVTRDFHFNSLGQAIAPLAIFPTGGHFSRVTLRVDIRKADDVIALLQNTWRKHFPSALFDYDFVSEQIKAQYKADERFSDIFLYFSILSLLIACLGLYGLISFAIFQKTKEIGIRKVLGATVSRLAIALSGNFVKLVLLAYVISVPIAWYCMNRWLEDFAYRIGLSWWMFAVAGLLVLLIAILTVGIQSIKAALVNPVKNLRAE
ncbi:MAG TPA: FtsX-like permease family protein, partial [Flavisolibacter sp.]